MEVMYTMLDLYIFVFEVKNLKKELGDFKYKIYRMYVILIPTTLVVGMRGGVVVKTLRYKPADHGFDSRWCHWNFSVT